jgi:hypothetical protein
MAKKKIFIIHGRDLEAYEALARFVKALGLDVLDFENVAGSLGPAPFVADVVFKAIETADAIVALFTPDEHAALYSPTGSNSPLAEHDEARWQARPNVIFEAGIALGSRREHTILATLGADVQLFSDVNGKHFVRLDAPDGKAQLRNRLIQILFPEGGLESKRGARMSNKTFAPLARSRWSFYDEVHLLANRMHNHMLGKQATPPTLLNIVSKIVLQKPLLEPAKLRPKGFMERVEHRFPNYAKDVYWWLIVFGFFRFIDDDDWGLTNDYPWEPSARHAEIAERGVALVRRIQLVGS